MRLRYIDSLRGLAVLGVVFTHLNVSNYSTFLEKIPGEMGVQLFFIISAFTIFLTASGKVENSEDRKQFFVRRYFRIAPMYYLAIVYYLIQNGQGGVRAIEGTISWKVVLSNCLFVHGFSPYTINWLVPGGWTIAVEFMFYVIAPLLLLRIKTLKQAISWGGVVLILCTIIVKILYKIPIETEPKWYWLQFIFYSFPSQLPVFFCGIVLYFVTVKKDYEFGKFNLLIGSLLVLIQLIFPNIFPRHYWFSFVFIFMAYAINLTNPVVIVNPVLNFIGKVSYSVYLIHFAVIHWLEKLGIEDFLVELYPNLFGFIIMYGVVLSITITLSYFTFGFIEIPFQRIAKGKW